MNKIFLSYSYRDENEQLADDIDRLIRSHGLLPVTGKVLGGAGLTPQVQRLIANSDALVAVLTRDTKIPRKDAWRAPPWVETEYVAARARGQRAIALVEDGVKVDGLYAENERIPFKRKELCPALVRLSENIGLWRADAGRSLMIRLLPEDAAKMATNKTSTCRFRLVPPIGPAGNWEVGSVRVQPGGVFLAIQNVKLDVAIDVEIEEGGNPKWRSFEYPQWVHVELRSVP